MNFKKRRDWNERLLNNSKLYLYIDALGTCGNSGNRYKTKSH